MVVRVRIAPSLRARRTMRLAWAGRRSAADACGAASESVPSRLHCAPPGSRRVPGSTT